MAMWRGAVMLAGNFQCAGCGYGVVRYLEADHIIPRAQGGLNDVDNGLVLCGEFGQCKRHPRKTAGEPAIIEHRMLRDEQVAYLSEHGWVEWVETTRLADPRRQFEPHGPGMKHFAAYTLPR